MSSSITRQAEFTGRKSRPFPEGWARTSCRIRDARTHDGARWRVFFPGGDLHSGRNEPKHAPAGNVRQRHGNAPNAGVIGLLASILVSGSAPTRRICNQPPSPGTNAHCRAQSSRVDRSGAPTYSAASGFSLPRSAPSRGSARAAAGRIRRTFGLGRHATTRARE